MENSNLRRRVLMEIENLVVCSCPKQKVPQKFKNLHVAIVKNHYNATDVLFDYHRKRVELDIVMDDRDYNPERINLSVPTLHANLWFRNLCEFLKTCIDNDSKSVAFYAGLLRSYQKNETHFIV